MSNSCAGITVGGLVFVCFIVVIISFSVNWLYMNQTRRKDIIFNWSRLFKLYIGFDPRIIITNTRFY